MDRSAAGTQFKGVTGKGGHHAVRHPGPGPVVHQESGS